MSTSQDHAMGFSDPAAVYRCDYDGFEGHKIGEYTTREGFRGVVLQHLENKVVHVYRADRVKLVENVEAASKVRKAMIDRLIDNIKKDFALDTTDRRLDAIEAVLKLHSRVMDNNSDRFATRLDAIESALIRPILTTKPKD